MGKIKDTFTKNLRNKLILTTVLVALLVMIIVGGYAVWVTSSALTNQVSREQVIELDTLSQRITNFLGGLEQDVLLLSKSQPLAHYLNTVANSTDLKEVEQKREAVLAEFFVFAQTRKIYDQVRFIDADGNEVIRVNTDSNGVSYVVPEEKLQNKANRYYFSDSIAVSPGKIFVSPLDLNVEKGEIELLPDGSNKPVIRYGTPVVFEDQVVGVIVTNVLANKFLNLLENLDSSVYMVDEDGYYLYHPEEEKRWGRDLGTDITLFNEYSPDTAQQMLSNLPGAFTDKGSFYAHQPVSVPEYPDITWYLGKIQSQQVVFQPVLNFWYGAIFVAAIALVVAILAAIVINRAIVEPVVELNKAALRVAEGQFDTKITPRTEDEIGSLVQAFNIMADQVQELVEGLENRVQNRTGALEASTIVSRQISTVLDVDLLLKEVVRQIQDTFGFYHVHIYLVNRKTGELVMREGTGVVGQQLKTKGHKLQPGQGIVGKVVQSGTSFLAETVDNVPNFFRNPLLPNTQAELAVPIQKGDEILGVLDLQSNQIGGFDREDLTLMQSIANQIAVALENARLFQELRISADSAHELSRQLTKESWGNVTEQSNVTGFSYTKKEVLPSATAWLPAMEQAVKQSHLINTVSNVNEGDSNGQSACAAVPLMLRDEVIGVIGIERSTNQRWSEDELSAVEAVADQIARALENARLSKEQEKTIVQLKDLDRLKSEFLTSMSHELRTPLNSIIGFSDVLLQGIDGELPDLAMNDIQLIYNSGQHLLALINDVLDLSKIEAERMELVLEEIDMSEIVGEVLAASSSLFKEKPVELIVDVPENLPSIQADRLRLNQVLLNLISNAAKFTHKGNITISSKILNGTNGTPDKMRIAVSDTGIGIPPEKQSAVFDRFRQADSSTTRKYGGTGLGLAICQKLVDLHGGEIGVISAEEKGSEFYFTIPLVEAPSVITT